MAAGADRGPRVDGADPDRPRRPHARRARRPPGARGDDGPASAAISALDLDLVERRCGARGGGSATRSRATGPMTFARFMELALYDPERRLLPRRCRAAGTRRRLPDGARGPSDLRPGDRPARDRRVVRAGTPGNVRDPRARRGHRGAGGGARRRRPGDGARPRRRPPLPGRRGRAASPRGSSRARLGDVVEPDDGAADRGARARERGARRAADASRRGRGPAACDEVFVAIVDGGLVDSDGPPSTPALDARLARRGHHARRRASGPRSASHATPGSRALPAASHAACCC